MIILASDCDSKCTFDVDCPFPLVCKEEECVKDSSVLWKCPGVFSDPRLACKKFTVNSNPISEPEEEYEYDDYEYESMSTTTTTTTTEKSTTITPGKQTN